MFLLDTNIVSELRRQRPHGSVLSWFETTNNDILFLSAVTIGEIQAGIELTREQDPLKAKELEAWMEQLAGSWGILAVDARIFRVWARLMHRKSDALSQDALIAATAIVHDLTLVTRNIKDFAGFDVRLHNPFTA